MEAALIGKTGRGSTIAGRRCCRRAEKKRADRTFLAPFSGSCRNWKSIAARDVAIALLAEALSPTTKDGTVIIGTTERAARQAE